MKKKEKNMKKLISILLILVFVLSLTACGSTPSGGGETPSGGGETPSGGSDKPAEKVKITVWNYYSEHQLEYFQQVIKEFNESQDKYEVVYEGQTKDYLDNVAQAEMAGAGPDFLIEYGDKAAMWHEDDLVVDLSKYLDADTLNNLTDSARTYATGFDDGGMYLYPIIGTGNICWYIREALEAAEVEVPETWDELFAAAKQIHDKVTVKTSDTGLEFVTDGSGVELFGWTSSMDETLLVVANQCGGCYDPETKTINLDNPKIIDWLEKFQKGCQEGYLSSTFQNGYANTDQEAGITAMGSSSVAGRPYYNIINPGSTHEMQIDMADKANYATIGRSRGIIVFNNGEDKVKGVCEFIKFFTQPSYNAKFCEVMNYAAVLKGTLEDAGYKAYAGASEDLEKVWSECGTNYPNSPESSYLKTALKSIMGDVASGMDPKTAIENAVTTFNAQIG